MEYLQFESQWCCSVSKQSLHPEFDFVSAFPSKVHDFSVCCDTVSWNAIPYTEIENLVDCEKLKGLTMLKRHPVIPIKNMAVTQSVTNRQQS